MKYIALLFPLLFLIISCSKPANNVTVDTKTKFKFITFASDDYYTSGNIKDSLLTFTINDSSGFGLRMTFTLTAGSAANYPVKASIIGNTPGVKITPSTFVFALNQTIEFSFSVIADTGVYDYVVHIETSDGTNDYPIKLHVLMPFDWADYWQGKYSGSDPCWHFSHSGSIWHIYEAEMNKTPGRPHWLSIKNFRGMGDSAVIIANIWGSGGSLNFDVPRQSVNGLTVWGSGYTMGSEIVVNDTIIYASDTQTCRTQLKPHK